MKASGTPNHHLLPIQPRSHRYTNTMKSICTMVATTAALALLDTSAIAPVGVSATRLRAQANAPVAVQHQTADLQPTAKEDAKKQRVSTLQVVGWVNVISGFGDVLDTFWNRCVYLGARAFGGMDFDRASLHYEGAQLRSKFLRVLRLFGHGGAEDRQKTVEELVSRWEDRFFKIVVEKGPTVVEKELLKKGLVELLHESGATRGFEDEMPRVDTKLPESAQYLELAGQDTWVALAMATHSRRRAAEFREKEEQLAAGGLALAGDGEQNKMIQMFLDSRVGR